MKITKTYTVTASWTMEGSYNIEASSLQEAMKIAEGKELPDNGKYLKDSFKVDDENVQAIKYLRSGSFKRIGTLTENSIVIQNPSI
jgi:hypothetical protein